MIDFIENKIERESSTSKMLFKGKVFLEVSYLARKIYEMETVPLGLCYIEGLIFLENNVVWFWNFLDVQSTDSSVELHNILSYSRFFFEQLLTRFFGKGCIIQKKWEILLIVGYVDIKTYIH